MKRVRRILLWMVVVAVVSLGSFWVYLFHLGGLERIVNTRIAEAIDADANFDLTVGSVTGNFLDGIVAEKIQMYLVDSTQALLVLDIPRLSVTYTWSDIWRGRYHIDRLAVDSPTVHVIQDQSGRWMLPGLPIGSGGSKGGIPAVAIDELSIAGGTVLVMRPKDTVLVTDLFLSVAVQAVDETYAANLHRFTFRAPDGDFSLRSAGGKVTYAQGRLAFKDVSIHVGDARLKTNGTIELGKSPSGYVEFHADNLDLRHFGLLGGPKLKGVLDADGNLSFAGTKLTGSIDLGGDFQFLHINNLHTDFRFGDRHLTLDTVYGTILNGCSIDGKGSFRFDTPRTYQIVADISDFNLADLVPTDVTTELSGHIDLTGKSFKKEDMRLAVQMNLFESRLSKYPLHRAFGAVVITIDSLLFPGQFHVDYHENWFEVTGGLAYRDSINLIVKADLPRLDRWTDELFVRKPAGRANAVAALSGLSGDPNLSGQFTSDSLWLYGLYASHASARFDIERFLSGRQGWVEALLLDGEAWGIGFDTGSTALVLDSTLVRFESTRFINAVAAIDAEGSFDHGVAPPLVEIKQFDLDLFGRNYVNDEDIRLTVDSGGFDFLTAAIRGDDAYLSVAGRFGFDETLDARFRLEHVGISPWVSLFSDSLSFDGLLSCEATIRGNLLEPSLQLSGQVDSLMYRDLILGDMTAALRYSDERLHIDSLSLLSHPGEYRATGFFPLSLALTQDSIDRVPGRPMNISITASDSRFDLVTLLMPSVEHLDGKFSANVILSGTPYEPHLEGEASLVDGTLKYFDLEHPVHTDSATVTMQDNRVIFDRVEAYVFDNKKGGRKRYAYIDGELVVKSLDNLYYDLDISLPHSMPFVYELDDIEGKVEGELYVEGDTPPTVTGELTVLNCKYMVNFADADEGSPIMAALSGEETWDLNINIDILSNYWIKNDDIDAEFSGRLNVVRTDGRYRLTGDMELLRGRGFLMDKTFHLEPGSKVFFDGDETINPRLDIIGRTRIASQVQSDFEGNVSSEPLHVGIHISGTLEVPDISPSEDSPFSREDIMPLIFANYYSNDTLSASTNFERRVTDLISARVSQLTARRLGKLGVETFEIDPAYGQEVDPLGSRVTLGFYTGSNLYIYGRSALSGQSGQEVGFEYRFNKNLLMEGRREENELYRMIVRLHWEF
ncbi:MAG: translocation/assembly module TamB domain-containing protein [Candidatus Zixiibacteriota bacterium]